MKSINKILKFLPYIIIVILMLFLYKGCDGTTLIGDEYNQNKTETDTIYKDSTVKKNVPKDSLIFVPTPISIENKTDKKLLKQLDSLKNVNDRLNFLLQELAIRNYDTVYNFNDTKVKIEEKVRGSILKRKVNLSGNKETVYKTKTITNTITKSPNFLLSAGLSTGIETDFNNFSQPSIGADIEFQNKEGYQFQFRYNTSQRLSFSLKKPIFVKY